MKILITGARGQLGRDCQAVLAAAHEITATDLPEFDVSDAAQIRDRLVAARPDVILNCAAFTRVDDCETQRGLAAQANTDAPRLLAAAARVLGAHFVHISTDYVFDGARPVPQPYVESDATHPLSVYGATKLAGEKAVCASGARFAILRTAWLYGRHGGNFPKTMLRLVLAQPEQTRRVIAEQHGSPTWSWRLAEQIRAVIEARAEGVSAETLAARFQETVAAVARQLCADVREATGLRAVTLSGGVFQNQWLATTLVRRLTRDGFEVHTNRLVPANDGGISYGQAVVAAARLAGRS